MDNHEIIKTFFAGATGASALLAGFSFAAALQLVHAGQKSRLSSIAIVLLYSATLLFLFAVVGFNNAAVRPFPADFVIFQPDTLQFGRGRETFTTAFYLNYAPEFALALFAGLAFLSGVIISALSFSRRIGSWVLVIFILVFTLWSIWFFLPQM